MDQRKVGCSGWMVSHTLAHLLDMKLNDGQQASQRACQQVSLDLLDTFMVEMGNIFPCGRCRKNIKSDWVKPKPGEYPNMAAILFDFHALTNRKVYMTRATVSKSAKSVESVESKHKIYAEKYRKLAESRGWIVYLMSFLYAIVTNCSEMCKTITKESHGIRSGNIPLINFNARLHNFVEAIRRIDAWGGRIVPFGRVTSSPASCNEIFKAMYVWEKQVVGRHVFGSFEKTKAQHLCSRVDTPLYKPSVYQANFCGRKLCKGGCEICDSVAARIISNK